jgi:hypothetical protein
MGPTLHHEFEINMLRIFKIEVNVLSLVLALAFAGGVRAEVPKSSCVQALAVTPSADFILQRLVQMEKADASSVHLPERRLKILTTGLHKDSDGSFDPRDEFLDTADPSAPFWLTYPNGKRVVRIYFSGFRYIEANSLDELLRGGIPQLKRIRGFYADGTEMTGLYHQDSFPWDPELHQLPDGTLIGHGGVMFQRQPGTLPKVCEDNCSRSRQWAKVVFNEIRPGVYEERWYFQGSIYSSKPSFTWTDPDAGHFHNYGATFFRYPNGEYVRDRDGNFFMTYERVSEEKNGLPWVTEIFGVKVDPTMTHVIGPEIPIQQVRSPSGKPYVSSQRAGGSQGFLLEGPRPFPWYVEGKLRWIILFSGGDYVSDKYSVSIAVSKDENPLSAYTPVTDSQGELIDFSNSVRQFIDGTWQGRWNAFWDEHGRVWAVGHFISKAEIPDGEVKSGWPATAPEFNRRHRRVMLIPLKIVNVHGLPHLQLDVDVN